MWRITVRSRICVGACGLALAIGLVLALIPHSSTPEPIYTFATVQQGLRQNPGAWIGRTILVRAKVAGMAVTQSAGVAAAQGRVVGFTLGYMFGSLAMLIPRGTAPGLPVGGSFVRLVPSTATMYGAAFLAAPHLWAVSRVRTDLPTTIVCTLHRLPLAGSLFPAPTPWTGTTLLRLTLLPRQQRPCLLNVCAVAAVDDVIR
jgi:hypothetical protein